MCVYMSLTKTVMRHVEVSATELFGIWDHDVGNSARHYSRWLRRRTNGKEITLRSHTINAEDIMVAECLFYTPMADCKSRQRWALGVSLFDNGR